MSDDTRAFAAILVGIAVWGLAELGWEAPGRAFFRWLNAPSGGAR